MIARRIKEHIILAKLLVATKGTSHRLYRGFELSIFAYKYCNTLWHAGAGMIADVFVQYWWGTRNECRRCSVCGKLMREGYCFDWGGAYYCSDACLHADFTDKEWKEECEWNDQSYYTEWY